MDEYFVRTLLYLVMSRRTPDYELQMALAKCIERVLPLTVPCFAYDIPEGSDFLQEIWPEANQFYTPHATSTTLATLSLSGNEFSKSLGATAPLLVDFCGVFGIFGGYAVIMQRLRSAHSRCTAARGIAMLRPILHIRNLLHFDWFGPYITEATIVRVVCDLVFFLFLYYYY